MGERCEGDRTCGSDSVLCVIDLSEERERSVMTYLVHTCSKPDHGFAQMDTLLLYTHQTIPGQSY